MLFCTPAQQGQDFPLLLLVLLLLLLLLLLLYIVHYTHFITLSATSVIHCVLLLCSADLCRRVCAPTTQHHDRQQQQQRRR
jgi:hypothetical protein